MKTIINFHLSNQKNLPGTLPTIFSLRLYIKKNDFITKFVHTFSNFPILSISFYKRNTIISTCDQNGILKLKNPKRSLLFNKS